MYTVKRYQYGDEYEYKGGTKSVHLATCPFFAVLNEAGQIEIRKNTLTGTPHTFAYSSKKRAVAACERLNDNETN
jgi:hypothetical protein